MDLLKEIFDQCLHNQPDDLKSSTNVFKQDENWHDYIIKAEKLLEEENLDGAEQSLSYALKILSASTNSSQYRNEKAKCFHCLAEVYFCRSSQQLKKEGCCEMLTKCIALSEAERLYKYGCYKEDEDIDMFILKAETRLIEKTFGTEAVERFTNSRNMTPSNRLNLKEVRVRITNEYFPMLAGYPEWNSDEEHERCEAIEKIYESIHVDMKTFMSGVFLYCYKIVGSAPCNYAFVGLGSTSRKEATPYSDLEFAILIEEVNCKSDDGDEESKARAYFRFLTYLIQVEILKLGETLLPSLGIASLNNYYSENKEDDWFFDDVVPNGFSFDGSMPWACKTPLGRKSWQGKPVQEYIMTIDEMLNLQNVSASSSIECLETANVFSSVCFLYGNENLVTTYQEKLSATLTDTTRVVSYRHRIIVVIRNLLEKYRIDNLDLKGFGMQQNVKNEVYRLVSLLVEQITKYFGTFGKSSWQSIKEMCERKILTMDSARNLLVALSITTELRLKCYQKHGMQKEALPTVPQLSLSGNEDATNSDTSTIIRLYKSIFPLTYTMFQAIENPSDIHSVLLNANLYDDTPFSRAMAYMRILNLPKALVCFDLIKESVDVATKVKVLLLQAYCYRMVGRFYKVLKCCQEVEDLYSTVPQTLNYQDHLQALISMMHTYMDLSLYQEAVKIQEQIKASSSYLKKDAMIYFLTSSAVLFTKMERPRVAENLFKRIIEMLPNPRKSYFAYFTCVNNFAVLLLSENRLIQAKSILENALLIAKELYGENAIHSFAASCLTNLSKAYYGLHNLEKGDYFLQAALAIYKHVHGAAHIDPNTVDALVTKAKAHQFAGKWEEMRSTLTDAKQFATTLYGNQPHPLIAVISFLLGHCEYLRGRYSIALNHYHISLKIFEDHSKEIGSSTAYHCERATILMVIASIGNGYAFETSRLLSLIQKALDLEEEVHGKESSHVHLAQCYTRIGCNLVQKTKAQDGQEYLEKALRMFQTLKLENTYKYGHAHFQTGVVLSDISPHKAEEHLKTAETVLKKILTDENHIVFLTMNCCLMQIYRRTNRMTEGVNIADKVKRHFIEKRLSTTSQLSFAELYQAFKIAGFFESCGRRHTARAVLIKLISHVENRFDPTDPEDDHFMFLLWMSEEQAGNIYASDEMFDEAEAMFQRIITSTQLSTSDECLASDAYMRAKLRLAHVFVNTKSYSQAHDILSDLVNKYEINPNQFVNHFNLVTVFWLLGELNRHCLRLHQALKDLERAMDIYKDARAKMPLSVGKYELEAQIMNTFGLVYDKGNNPKRALEYFRSCLDVVAGKEATIDVAIFHHNMADTLREMGSFEDALVHYRKSLKIREILHAEDPVREDIATVLYNIAFTQYLCARYGEATETLGKLLPLRHNLLKKGGELKNYCAALVLKGNCHINQSNEAQHAKDAYEKAVDLLLKMSEGQPDKDCATVITNIGHASALLRDWKGGVKWFRQALQMKKSIYQEVESSPEVAKSCFLLAKALFKCGEHEEALVYFEEALARHQNLKSTGDVLECLLYIARCYKSLKAFEKVIEIFVEAEKLFSTCAKIDDRIVLLVHQEMADFFTEKEVKNKTKAIESLQKVAAILERMNDEETLAEVQAKILSLELS